MLDDFKVAEDESDFEIDCETQDPGPRTQDPVAMKRTNEG